MVEENLNITVIQNVLYINASHLSVLNHCPLSRVFGDDHYKRMPRVTAGAERQWTLIAQWPKQILSRTRVWTLITMKFIYNYLHRLKSRTTFPQLILIWLWIDWWLPRRTWSEDWSYRFLLPQVWPPMQIRSR